MQRVVIGLRDKKRRDRLERILQEINPAQIQRLPAQALAFLKHHRADLVLNDPDWLEKQDLEAWVNALKGGRHVVHWVVMGPSDTRHAVHWMRQGADDYLAEDLDDEEIRRILQELLKQPPLPTPWLGRKDMVLLQIIREISRNLDDLENLMNLAMDASMELSRADLGSLLVLQPHSNSLEVLQLRGPSEPQSVAWGLLGFTPDQLKAWMREGNLQFFSDPERYRSTAVTPMSGINSALVVPICDRQGPVGVLVLGKGHDSVGSFLRLERDLIEAFARDLAPVIRNAMVHAETRELNFKDDLTDAYNRRYFEQFLPDEIRRSERFGAKLSIIFMDLDNLKLVNEQYGHMMGSKTLQEIAHRMILAVRTSDRVIRYGGDEFCIILPETDTEGALQVAERLRDEIANRPFLTSEGLDVHITASFGIATYPTHGHDRDELIEAADRAMYRVKMTSKNGIQVAPPRLREQMDDTLSEGRIG